MIKCYFQRHSMKEIRDHKTFHLPPKMIISLMLKIVFRALLSCHYNREICDHKTDNLPPRMTTLSIVIPWKFPSKKYKLLTSHEKGACAKCPVILVQLCHSFISLLFEGCYKTARESLSKVPPLAQML